MKISLFLALSTAVIFSSCSKSTGGDTPPPCNSVAIVLSPSATSLGKGQTLNFQATAVSNVTYSWQIPGSSVVTSSSGSIAAVDFANEGWYVLTYTMCNQTKKDSFYLDVTVPQGAAPCSPASNSVSYTAAGHQSGTFNNIQQGESAIPNIYELVASGPTAGDLTVYFHPSYKNNSQPADGVYTTGTYNINGFPSFGATDYDKIFVNMITYWPATILYKATPGQKVYVTRVGGKMILTLCDVPMVGSSSGTPYSTNMTLSVTEQ